MTFTIASRKLRISLIIYLLLFSSAIYTAYHSYLLFHCLSELVSIITAFCVFILAWYTRKFSENNYLFFLGIAFLFIGSVDILHVLTYRGMGVLPDFDANLPTQVWLIARYIQAISFVAASLLVRKLSSYRRDVWMRRVFIIYALLTAFLLLILFSGQFPDSYTEGVGLTPFKKTSEYLISFILAVSAYLVYKDKKRYDGYVYKNLTLSLYLAIASEICFTFYFDVYDVFNMLGHFLKVASFLFIFLALVRSGLEEPYASLFGNLKESENRVKELNKTLEMINKTLRHDISNNLTAIGLNLDLYLMGKRKKKDLYDIKTAIKRSSTFINKMRQLEAAIKTGEDLKRYSIAEVVSKIKESNPRIKVELIGNSYVYADEAVYSVFDNLITNAEVHGRARSVKISVRKNGSSVTVKVADNGKGIPGKIKDSLFKEGFSYGRSGNTGLGLYIIKKTVERYGGRVDLGKNRTKGVEFVLTLPAYEREAGKIQSTARRASVNLQA